MTPEAKEKLREEIANYLIEAYDKTVSTDDILFSVLPIIEDFEEAIFSQQVKIGELKGRITTGDKELIIVKKALELSCENIAIACVDPNKCHTNPLMGEQAECSGCRQAYYMEQAKRFQTISTISKMMCENVNVELNKE
jgi:hypothetical protein